MSSSFKIKYHNEQEDFYIHWLSKKGWDLREAICLVKGLEPTDFDKPEPLDITEEMKAEHNYAYSTELSKKIGMAVNLGKIKVVEENTSDGNIIYTGLIEIRSFFEWASNNNILEDHNWKKFFNYEYWKSKEDITFREAICLISFNYCPFPHETEIDIFEDKRTKVKANKFANLYFSNITYKGVLSKNIVSLAKLLKTAKKNGVKVTMELDELEIKNHIEPIKSERVKLKSYPARKVIHECLDSIISQYYDDNNELPTPSESYKLLKTSFNKGNFKEIIRTMNNESVEWTTKAGFATEHKRKAIEQFARKSIIPFYQKQINQ